MAEIAAEKPSEQTKADATLKQSDSSTQDAPADVESTTHLTKEPEVTATAVSNATPEVTPTETGEDNTKMAYKEQNGADTAEESKDTTGRSYNARGRGGNHNRSNKRIRSDFDSQPESNDPLEIRRQVEFYFSDSNLPIDAYLLGLTGGAENKPVPLKTIHNFKRMRHFQPFSAVRDAVKASKFLNLSETDEITRKQPLDKKFGTEVSKNKDHVYSMTVASSIYAKGFGREQKSTHLDVEKFFEPYGPVRSVRLRRHDDNTFKGSVFVEFETEDLARAFLDLDPKPRWSASEKTATAGNDNEKGDQATQDEGVELQIMSKKDYMAEKHKGILDGTVKPGPSRDFARGRGRGGGNRGRERNGHGEDDWKSRRDRDQRNDRRDGRGFRGGKRGSRGGRGGRDRGDRRRDRNEEDDNGDDVPTRAEAEATRKEEPKANAEETNGALDSKKRARDEQDDSKVDQAQSKKAKADTEPTSA